MQEVKLSVEDLMQSVVHNNSVVNLKVNVIGLSGITYPDNLSKIFGRDKISGFNLYESFKLVYNLKVETRITNKITTCCYLDSSNIDESDNDIKIFHFEGYPESSMVKPLEELNFKKDGKYYNGYHNITLYEKRVFTFQFFLSEEDQFYSWDVNQDWNK